MTDNIFAPMLAGVPRYGTDPDNCDGFIPTPNGAWLDRDEVLAALAAAVPDDLAEAAEMAQRLLNEHDAFSGHAAYTITALLARIAAMKAQIKGLEAERDEATAGMFAWAKKAEKDAAALAALAAMAAERNVLRAKLQAMHRRAQRAEGLSYRSANLLETIMLSVKEAMKPEVKLSLHSLFHRVRAARDHARASSGRAWMEGWHYLQPKLKEAETALTAERAKTAKLVETYWLLRSFAVHDNHCKVNKPPKFEGPCSCGLAEALADGQARAAIKEASQ